MQIVDYANSRSKLGGQMTLMITLMNSQIMQIVNYADRRREVE